MIRSFEGVLDERFSGNFPLSAQDLSGNLYSSRVVQHEQ